MLLRLRWIRDLSVRAKAAFVVAAIAIALATELALSLNAIETLRVGGPVYAQIRGDRDAIERVSALQSDLNAYQAALLSLANQRDRDLVARGDRHRREIGERVDAGFEEALSASISDEIRVGLESARRTWQEFRDACEAQVVPAMLRGDPEGVRELLAGTQERRSRRFIEQVGTTVNQLRMQVDALEGSAATDARRRVRSLVLAVVATVIATLAIVLLVVGSFTRPLRLLTASANRIAGGTIPEARLSLGTRDELGTLANVFDEMLDAIRDMVGGGQGAARRLEASAKDLLAANRQMSEGAKEQSAQLAAVNEETSRMATALHELSATADAVSHTASQNAAAAEEGARAVGESRAGLEAIQAASGEVRTALLAVADASERIGTIVRALQDIAVETHVLSLNASIEAARAGEAGRGFAIVASEVRGLAARAAESSKEITHVVAGIFDQMRAAQAAVERNVAATARGTESGRILARAFESIHESARATHASIEEMTSVLRDQVGSTQRTAGVVEAVARVSEESLAATEQVVSLGSALEDVVRSLEALLGRFAVEGSSSAAVAPAAALPAAVPPERSAAA